MRYAIRVCLALVVAAPLGLTGSAYGAGRGGHGGHSGGGHSFGGAGRNFGGGHSFGGTHSFSPSHSFGGARSFGGVHNFSAPGRSFSAARPITPSYSFTPSHAGSGFHGQGMTGGFGTRPFTNPGFRTITPGVTNGVRPGVAGVSRGARHFAGGVGGNQGNWSGHNGLGHPRQHNFAHSGHHHFDHFGHHHHRFFPFFFPASVWGTWFPYGYGYYPYSDYYYPYSYHPYRGYYSYPYDYGTGYPSEYINNNYYVYPNTGESQTPPEVIENPAPGGAEGGYVAGSAASTGQYFDQAVEAFRRGDYAEAFRLSNHAAVDDPRNPHVPELMSLTLFAQGNYPAAAMAAHAALTLGPATDWATLYGYYGDVSTYQQQLDALMRYIQQNPSSGEARFLLAYQNLMMGHTDVAKQQLADVLRLAPQDKVAQQVLDRLNGGAATAATGPRSF